MRHLLKSIKLKIVGIALSLLFFQPEIMYAHGFGERYDLPVPFNYFMVAAASTVLLSFVFMAYFIRTTSISYSYLRFNLYSVVGFRKIFAIITTVSKLFAVLLFLLVILTGFFGTKEPLDNFAPTFVWIIWWVGIVFFTALLGNVWLILNPWLILYTVYEKFSSRQSLLLTWPKNFDAWPAVTFYLMFCWIENVYVQSSQPFNLAVLILIYTVLTFTGMFVFGKHVWLRNADPFFVLFQLFSKFSPIEFRVINENCVHKNNNGQINTNLLMPVLYSTDCLQCWENCDADKKEINIRPWFVGLASGGRVNVSIMVFHIIALATVTFDGFSETPAWVGIQNLLWPIVSPLPGSTVGIISSLGIFLIPIFSGLVYVWVCSKVSKFSNNKISTSEVILRFVFSLVPIAIAYNFSHYISFIVITGQNIIPLLSDPFGFGWNLIGTSNYIPYLTIIDAQFVWLFSLAALVIGHVISVYIAHVIVLRYSVSHARAIKSQIPMLILMVFYTVASLWIIAQPIIE